MRDGQILHLPEAHDSRTAREVCGLKAVANADVVIVADDTVIKSRFDQAPRAATADELAAAEIVRYVPTAA